MAAAGRPYSFYEVDNPMPGTWQVEVAGPIRVGKFRTIGFEVNDRIYLELSAAATHVRAGQPIRLRGRLRMPQAVPGAKFNGWVRSPSGKWSKFRFVEHTGAAGDREEPFVHTAELKTSPRERGQYLISVDARRAKGQLHPRTGRVLPPQAEPQAGRHDAEGRGAAKRAASPCWP